jgi:early endosome antigen 1
LIQQKLELQGKIDSLKATLEQEKRNQQILKEQVKKEQDELKKEFVEKEAKLVSELLLKSVFCNRALTQSSERIFLRRCYL